MEEKTSSKIIDDLIEKKINHALSFMNKDNIQLKLAVDDLELSAKENNHKYGIAYSTWFNGVIEAHNNNFEKAINLFNLSLQLAEQENFEKLRGASYMNIANLHMMKGELDKAIVYYKKNLDINKKLNNLVGLGVCYSNLSTIYGKYMKDIPQALEFSLKSEECYIKANATNRLPAIYTNIANSYLLLNNISKAINYAELIIDYGNQVNNSCFLAEGHLVYTSIYLKNKDFDKTAFHLKECKKFFNLVNIKFNDYNLDFINAELLLESGRKEEAFNAYINMVNTYDQSMDLYISLEINTRLVSLFEEKNDFENAFKFQKKIIELKDILFKSDTNDALQKQKVEFQTEKLENEYKLKLVKSEIDTLRAQMNPHFIFNSLSSINRYILKNETDEASDYLVKFSQLIRTVLDNARSESVSLHDELKTLKLYIQIEALRFGKKINYEFNLDDDMYLHDIDIPPLLLQPYVENALWHGLMQKESDGLLTIKTNNNGNEYVLEIDDNGIGREKANELKSTNNQKHNSHGLKVTEDRIKLYNETNSKKIKVETIDKYENNIATGTKIIFTFEH